MKHIILTPEEQSAAYHSSVWNKNTYDGLTFKLASRNTPLLEGFIGLVGANPARVIEAGPGAGGHTIRLAQAGVPVTAVESSPEAVRRTKRQRTKHGLTRQIDIVAGSILDYIAGLSPGEQRHFYAQGVLQFFSNDNRQKLLRDLSRAQLPGGFIGVSFKTKYDGLLHQGRLNGRFVNDKIGAWVSAADESGRRLFVNVDDITSLREEFIGNGYDIVATPRWYEVDYTDRKEVFSLPSVESKPEAEDPVDWIGFLAVKK